MNKITVEIDIEKLVPITDDHGGYEAGECLLCGASGWLVENRLGYHYKDKDVGADLQHKKACPMNKEIK